MKKIFITTFIFAIIIAKAQFTIHILATKEFSPKEAILYTLDGSKDIVYSKEIKRDGSWTFNVKNNYLGMLKCYFPEINSSITFISENKEVKIKLDTSTEKINSITYLDESNILMEKIQDIQQKNELIFPALVQIREYYKGNSVFGKALDTEITRLGDKIIIDPNIHPFVSYYNTNYNKYVVKSSTGKNATSSEIENFLVSSNQMLESSSLMRPILVNFLNSGSSNTIDSSVDHLLSSLNVETPRGQTVLSEIIEIFDTYGMESSKEKYLTEAKNLKCTINGRLASTITSNEKVKIGAVFQDYKFVRPTNTKAKSIYEVKADKKIFVFWSSVCSHCEKELPLILEKYSELKKMNIEVIGLSMDTEMDSYNKKITIFPWINDSELKGWNSSYAETYNIHATPSYFILDSKNTIIAKPEHVADVFQYLNLK